MQKSDAITALIDRIEQNAKQVSESYNTANDLLNVAVAEAFPWVIGLPVVQNKIPKGFRNVLPKGAPLSLEKLERLATQLFAVLAASYEAKEKQTKVASD